jgi:undecaprenyl-diphosphatase
VQILQYIILGVLQGLTEFLPVSSKSHLLLGERLLGLDPQGVVLEVALHVATLLSVVIVYGADLLREVRERNWRFFGLIFIALLPLVPLLPFKDHVEALAERDDVVLLIGLLLLVTAGWLALADWRLRQQRAPKPLNPQHAIWVGVAQAVALLPGISRSGATIGAAIQLGEERARAARFSFVLSIPTILGAAVLKADEIGPALASGEVQLAGLIAGFIAALLSGILAIKLVLWMLQRARLTWFAAYCVALSLFCLGWHFLGAR